MFNKTGVSFIRASASQERFLFIEVQEWPQTICTRHLDTFVNQRPCEFKVHKLEPITTRESVSLVIVDRLAMSAMTIVKETVMKI